MFLITLKQIQKWKSQFSFVGLQHQKSYRLKDDWFTYINLFWYSSSYNYQAVQFV